MKKELKEEIVEAVEEVSPKSGAWTAFLAKYEKENPVKYASKKARGEFDKIPANFK
jgi:hypothetical protein